MLMRITSVAIVLFFMFFSVKKCVNITSLKYFYIMPFLLCYENKWKLNEDKIFKSTHETL
jgi:hypothetical protein